jgi:tRNA A37 threonylcarbamoyladenosine dehydratase
MTSDKFLSLENLIGKQGQEKLANSHACLIGLGGVGSWVAEALVRSGIGKLTLIDMDHIVASNINRQIQATVENIGQSKLQALSDRIQIINSNCELILIDDFLSVDNLSSLIHEEHNVVVDAIDQVKVKSALADYCSDKKINLVISGSAGGRLNPEKIKVKDLLDTYGDPLLAKVRKEFKKKHAGKKKSKVIAIFSDEQIIKPQQCDKIESNLNCAGYGSSIMVTATMGFYLASEAQKIILKA